MIALINDRAKSYNIDLSVFINLSVRSLLLIDADCYKEGNNAPHDIRAI